MAMTNAKRIKNFLITLKKQLGREITNKEFVALLLGDNSVISKKNQEKK
jgi:hypothetical protein